MVWESMEYAVADSNGARRVRAVTDHLQQALAFAQILGDPRWEAYGLLHLGSTARARGRHDGARRHLEWSLRLFDQAGDRHGASSARQVITS
jgi:hypothetical protein